MCDRILRLPAVIDRYGKSRSVIYDEVKRGTFVPPIPLGGRLIGFPEAEVAAIIRARIAGKDDAGVRALVMDLVSRRRSQVA